MIQKKLKKNDWPNSKPIAERVTIEVGREGGKRGKDGNASKPKGTNTLEQIGGGRTIVRRHR